MITASLAPLALLVWLLIAHCYFDYAGQGDFMATAKNHIHPIRGVPWYLPMVSHCALHAGAVWYLTHSWECGMLEFISHYFIDVWKNDASVGAHSTTKEHLFVVDQLAHVLCKIAWAFFVGMGWL